MSFDSTPVGLVRKLGLAYYTDLRPDETWSEGSIASCSFEGIEFVIFTPASTDVDLAASPSVLDQRGAFTGGLAYATYYAVYVFLRAPGQLKTWHDPPACLPPPANYGVAHPQAASAIDGTILDATGNTIPSSYSATGADSGAEVSFEGYLVNPSPPWPVPDGAGNTFGRVLWLAADVPTVTGHVFTERGPGGTSGEGTAGITVLLRGYDLGTQPPASRKGCVVGAA